MRKFIFLIIFCINSAICGYSQCGIAIGTPTTAWSCVDNTGSIFINPVGGALPYSFIIDGGIPQTTGNFYNVPAGNHNISIADANACSFTFVMSLTPNSNLTGVTRLNEIPCNKISTLPLGGYPPYLISINGGAFQSSFEFTNLPAGTYYLVIKDATNCVASLPPVIILTDALVATSFKINTLCPGSTTGSLTINAANGTAPYTYSIDGSTFQTSKTFTGLAAGYYNITVKDINGCNYTFLDSISNSLSAVAAISNTQNSACSGSATGGITVTPTSGIPPFKYSLDGGSLQTSNIFTAVAPGIHSILVTDAPGCTTVISATVNSNVGVSASAIISNAGCPGSATGKITVNASTGVAPYLYSLNGGSFQSSNIFTGLLANTYNLTVKDAAGCLFNFSAIINNDPLVSAALTITNPLCFGTASGSILINPVLGTSPYWYSLDNNAFQSGNNFNNLTAGTYAIHVKDGNGCIKDTTITLTQPLPVNAVAATTASTCASNDGTITLSASGGTSPYLYSDGINGFQSSNILKAGPGNFTVWVKDNQGCLFNTAAKVNLVDDMFLSLGNDTTTCSGVAVALIPTTNGGTNIFDWLPKNGTLNSSTGAYLVAPADTTQYLLTATYGACQRTRNITVNILRKPIADAGKDSTICEKTTAFLHGSASNLSGSVNFSWSQANDLNSLNTDTTTATPVTVGAHTYTLIVSDNYGCNFKVSDNVIISVNPPPPAFAGNDTIAALYLPHQLLGRGGVTYSWSPAGSLNNPFIKNPIALLSRDTKFILTVTDNAGCTANDTVNIKVYAGPAYYVPNAFSPNGDGLNDVFRAIPPGIVKTDYFRIFNRWGKLVFETHQYLKGWDGTSVGKPQPNGVYLWEISGIDKFGDAINQKGSVMLIR